jgi:uncharacterized protein
LPKSPYRRDVLPQVPLIWRVLCIRIWDVQKHVPPVSKRRFGDSKGFREQARHFLQSETSAHSLRIVKQFLEFIIRQLVEFPDEMMLSEIPSGKTTIFRVQLRQTDVGRIIGRNGQTIQAIRALLASSAARHGQRATLEIVE